MVDLSNVPQYDSGLLDSPVDRTDVSEKKLKDDKRSRIDKFVNSKFNKTMTSITDKLGNAIFNPKKKISYVIKGLDILTDGRISKNVNEAVVQVRDLGKDYAGQLGAYVQRLKKQLADQGITFTRGMDKSGLNASQKSIADEIEAASDMKNAISNAYKAPTTDLSNAIKKDVANLSKAIDKDIAAQLNWKTSFGNVFPGIKSTRQTSKKVASITGVGATTPSGAAKVYEFTYKGLAAKHGGPNKLDEIIRNKKHPKHDEIMTTFRSAVKNYSAQMDDLYKYKDELLENYVDDILEVQAKYGSGSGLANTGVIDFAHKFPVSQTARMSPSSELLDKAGDPALLYLSPSFVNRKVQVFFDDLAERILKGKPDTYINRPASSKGIVTDTRYVNPYDNMTMNTPVFTDLTKVDEFLKYKGQGPKPKGYDTVKAMIDKIDAGLKNVRAESIYDLGSNRIMLGNSINPNMSMSASKREMKDLLNYLLDPSVNKDTLIQPFKDGEDTKIDRVALNQQFFEEGVGDESYGSRILGLIFKGKLLEPTSSGFGREYDARNLPILKDADPLTQGVWNTLAPYGEKIFDALDFAVRAPGAVWADAMKMYGYDDNAINKLQAEINTVVGLPVANIMSAPIAIRNSFGQVNKIASNAKRVAKLEDNSNPNVTTQKELVQFPKAKAVDLGYNSRFNPNTKQLELYDGNNLIGSFDSAEALAAEVQNLNAGKWSTQNYKPNQNLDAFDVGFQRYSKLMEGIAAKYAPDTTKTGSQWLGELQNSGFAKELDRSGFGLYLRENADTKLTAVDLWRANAERGSQINVKPTNLAFQGNLNLEPEFGNLMSAYSRFMDGFDKLNANPAAGQRYVPVVDKFSGMPIKLMQDIKKEVDAFNDFIAKSFSANGTLTDAKQKAIETRGYDIIANFIRKIEKIQGRTGETAALDMAKGKDNYPLTVYTSSQFLNKNQFGSEIRNHVFKMINLKRDYGTTAEHAQIMLPGNAGRATQSTDVYTYNPLKNQKDYKEVGLSSHFDVPHQWGHTRSSNRTTMDGLNGIFIDEIQYDVLKGIDKSDKKVFKADTMLFSKNTADDQMATLKQQESRIFGNELKKLLVRLDVDDTTDYNLPQNQRQLNEKARAISDDNTDLNNLRQRILSDYGTPGNYLESINNKAYDKISQQMSRIDSEYSDVKSAVLPDIPHSNRVDAMKEILKAQIQRAIEGNMDFVAIPSPESVVIYEGQVGSQGTSIAFNNIYRKQATQAANELAEEYGQRLKALGLDGESFTVTNGDDVQQFFSWKKTDDGAQKFAQGYMELMERYGFNNPEILAEIASGDFKGTTNGMQPMTSYGNVPGDRVAIKPEVFIDLRNLKGFDRNQLAKIGFQEYKEGGRTKLNPYSALASIDLGVAV